MKGADLAGHSGNDEIGTPQWLFDMLDRRFQFDYDAAASHENRKTHIYSTVDGTFSCGSYGPWVGPPQLYVDGDGLGFRWKGRRVFVNPPYSRPLMGQFIQKAIDERNNAEVVVMAVKYDASTENGRLLREHFHLEYLPRIQYEYPKAVIEEMRAKAEATARKKGKTLPANWTPPAATFPSVIAIVKPDFIRPGKEK